MAERVSKETCEFVAGNGENPTRERWLALDLLDARRERDAAREALLWTWDKAEAREEDPSGNTLAAVAAARAAEGGGDE